MIRLLEPGVSELLSWNEIQSESGYIAAGNTG